MVAYDGRTIRVQVLRIGKYSRRLSIETIKGVALEERKP